MRVFKILEDKHEEDENDRGDCSGGALNFLVRRYHVSPGKAFPMKVILLTGITISLYLHDRSTRGWK